MVQITRTFIKGDAAEQGEPNMVIAVQCWFYDLQVIEQLTRYNDSILQPLRSTKISLSQYGLRDSSKGGFGSVLSTPKERIYVTEDVPVRVHDIHGFWYEEQ